MRRMCIQKPSPRGETIYAGSSTKAFPLRGRCQRRKTALTDEVSFSSPAVSESVGPIPRGHLLRQPNQRFGPSLAPLIGPHTPHILHKEAYT